MIGSAYLRSGDVAGANGGRIDFYERSAHDTTSFDATLGTLGIYNVGAVVSGARGGASVFHDDSVIRGSHLLIYNQTAEYLAPGAFAGSTSFLDRSRAGQVSIENAGAVGAGAAGGTTYFRNQANAQNATIMSLGGAASGAGGGSTQFSDNASAGASSLRNAGGSEAGAIGATLEFRNASRAGTATIVNAPGEVLGAKGGVTTFSDDAGAGHAYISNQTSLSAGGGGRGTTLFMGSSSAQNATIDNQGGIFTINAYTVFSQSATAGNALITNFGGSLSGVSGGLTTFIDQSTAGSATLIVAGGGVNGALGGRLSFFAGTTAGSATLSLLGASVAGAAGGTVNFANGSSAGSAQLSVQGAQVNNLRGPEAASVAFEGMASASNATIIVGGNLFAGGAAGEVQFNGNSTAAFSTISLIAGQDRGGTLYFKGSDALNLTSAGSASIVNRGAPTGALGFSTGGITAFQGNATAAAARITNESGVAFGFTAFYTNSSAGGASIINAGGLAGEGGGQTQFTQDSTAGTAVIANRAGARGMSGFNAIGSTDFVGHSSAGSAHITADGANSASDVGGQISFGDTATAASATLTADGGTGGGGGGRIRFAGAASGGSARVVLNAGSTAQTGGELDIGAVDVWLPVGSIEGGGSVNLGARTLIVVGNGSATTLSGVIRGNAPPVFPSLAVQGGSLTLTGANVYAGRTSIGDGLNANSGKLVAANTSGSATGSGAVRVERGGTLAGSGFIAGPVTLLAGGTIAPGDPVTLTLQDSLTWDGGGVIRLVLGADDAGSDHLVVHRLVRGEPGSFAFQFVDGGINPAASYSLLQFDAIEGFGLEDFSVVGVPGNFSLVNGALGFTAAVPEPGESLLFLAGLLCIWRVRVASDRSRAA